MVLFVKPDLEIVSRLFFLIGLGWLGFLVTGTRDDDPMSAEPTVGPRDRHNEAAIDSSPARVE